METLFYVICTTLPSHIIAFFQYWKFPWRSRWLGLTLVTINVLIKFATVNWAFGVGANIRAIELMFSLAGFSIYLCTLRVSPAKQLFTFVLIVDYLIIVRGLASFLAIRIWSAHPQSWRGSLLCLIMYLISLPPMLVYFRATAHAVEKTVAPTFWRSIWLAPGLTTALMLMFTNAYEPADSASIRSLIAHVALLVCVLFVYSMMLRGIGLIRQQTLLEEQSRQSNLLLEFQRAQYAHLKLSMDDLRQAHQAQYQQQQIIKSLLEAGDIDALRTYMQSRIIAQSSEHVQRYCSNNAIDALLRFYEAQVTRMGIRIDITAQLPRTLPMPEPDICVVLGNLLENAMEACAGQTQPHISLTASFDDDVLALSVTNTAPIQPNAQADGGFASTKHSGEGIGTQSVRYIAQRYGGSAEFSWADGVFYADVRREARPASSLSPGLL